MKFRHSWVHIDTSLIHLLSMLHLLRGRRSASECQMVTSSTSIRLIEVGFQGPLLSWRANQICSCASGIEHQWRGSESSWSGPGFRSVPQTASSRCFWRHENHNKPATGRNCTLFVHFTWTAKIWQQSQHPSSVNFKVHKGEFGSNYLAYFTIMHSKRLYAWETGPVDDAALALLCGDIADFKVCHGPLLL